MIPTGAHLLTIDNYLCFLCSTCSFLDGHADSDLPQWLPQHSHVHHASLRHHAHPMLHLQSLCHGRVCQWVLQQDRCLCSLSHCHLHQHDDCRPVRSRLCSLRVSSSILKKCCLNDSCFFLSWYFLLPISLAAVFYFGFIAYLLVYLLICIGFTSIASYPTVKKYYRWCQSNCCCSSVSICTILPQGLQCGAGGHNSQQLDRVVQLLLFFTAQFALWKFLRQIWSHDEPLKFLLSFLKARFTFLRRQCPADYQYYTLAKSRCNWKNLDQFSYHTLAHSLYFLE